MKSTLIFVNEYHDLILVWSLGNHKKYYSISILFEETKTKRFQIKWLLMEMQ